MNFLPLPFPLNLISAPLSSRAKSRDLNLIKLKIVRDSSATLGMTGKRVASMSMSSWRGELLRARESGSCDALVAVGEGGALAASGNGAGAAGAPRTLPAARASPLRRASGRHQKEFA
jgi:hypothetical protein